MTDKLNRCYFQAASSGSGDFVYASTVSGFVSPSGAGAVDGDEFQYIAENGTPPTEWEIGTGAYTAGTTTLARTTITASSNAGAAVTFSAAPKVRMGVPLASDFRSVSSKYLNLANSNSMFDGALIASGDPSIEQVFIGSSNIASADFSDCTSLNWLTTDGAGLLSSLIVSGCTALTRLYSNNTSISTIDITTCSNLVELTLSNAPLSSGLDLSGNPNLQSMEAEGCGFTDLDISNNPLIGGLYLAGNALTESAVDGILVALDGFGLSSGEVDLSGGSNAPPSATGLVAKTSLEGKSWTVTVN